MADNYVAQPVGISQIVPTEILDNSYRQVTGVVADGGTTTFSGASGADWDVATSGNYGGPTSGPLVDLYKNKFQKNAIHYPKDLDALDKGHSIQFDIRDIVTASGVKQIANVVGTTLGQAQDLANNKELSLQQKATSAGKLAITATKTISSALTGSFINNGNASINPETTKDVKDTIRLYMPDSLSFDYKAQYDKLSLAEAINSVPLVAKVSNAITGLLNKNEASKALQQKIGYTFNPQQQTIFEGIDFREFEMQFIFTPKSKLEAYTVQQIITKLRIAAAPTKETSAGGFFFRPPSIFDISFFFNGQINYSIPPIRPCVLQTVTVNYAPNGWAAMRDGSPVQTVIGLSFKELDLVDRASIQAEYQMTAI